MGCPKIARHLFLTLLLFCICHFSNSQINTIHITNEVDTVTQICFRFDQNSAVKKFELTIHLNRRIRDGFYNGHGYQLHELKRTGTNLEDICIDTTFNAWSYRLFYSLRIFDINGDIISNQFYSSSALEYGVLSFDFSDGILNLKENSTSLVDPYWQIRYEKKNYIDGPHNKNSETVPAWHGHILVYKSKFTQYDVRSYIYNFRRGIDEQMAANSTKMESIDTTRSIEFSSSALRQNAPYQLSYSNCTPVNTRHSYVHRDISGFNFISQNDTLINGSLFRKINLQLLNKLNNQETKLRTNLPVNAYYYYDGSMQSTLNCKPGDFRFSIIYPSRNVFNNEPLHIELGAGHIPYVAPLAIPRSAIDSTKFMNTTIIIKPKNYGRYAIVISGNHQENLDTNTAAFIDGLKDYNYNQNHIYTLLKEGKNWETNFRENESITILLFDSYRKNYLGSWTGKIGSSDAKKTKSTVELANGEVVQIRLTKKKYKRKTPPHYKHLKYRSVMSNSYEVSPD